MPLAFVWIGKYNKFMANARIVKIAFSCGHERIYSDKDTKVFLDADANRLTHVNGWTATRAQADDTKMRSDDVCGRCRSLPVVGQSEDARPVMDAIDRAKILGAMVACAPALGVPVRRGRGR